MNDDPTTPIKISKLEAARRQLETAIELFFGEAHPVSTHTLVCAAYEVLTDLSKHKLDFPTLRDCKSIKEEKRKEYIKAVRSYQSFFKHANQDPEGCLLFRPNVTPYFVWDAIRVYKAITKKTTFHMNVFLIWHQKIQHVFFKKEMDEQSKMLCQMMPQFGDNPSAKITYLNILRDAKKIKGLLTNLMEGG